MDGSRFDELARSLAGSGSRRRFLGGLVAGVLGVAAAETADAARCRGAGETCREHANCCSNTCGAPDSRRRRQCSCLSAKDCPAPKVCQSVTCLNGACVTSVTPGASCLTSGGQSGTCQGTICVPDTTPTSSTTTACLPNEDGCSLNSDCCSGFCDQFSLCANPVTTTGTTSSCGATGAPCAIAAECCDFTCSGGFCV